LEKILNPQTDNIHAFLFFIFSLILMLTIFDGPLAIYSEDIMVEMLDVILTGSALLIGISFLLRAMRVISKYYFK
jgi:glucan phosphoethanolaminetransferase (alkaline phosphatase superfamily)